MKKLLLLLLFSIFFLNSQGQTYHRFLGNDAWYQSVRSWGNLYHRWYTKSNDTLINSQSYAIIKQNHGSSYPYYIREDTILRKVYVIYDLAHAEQVLYDFSLNPGDSIYGYKLISIDSVQTNLGYRKKFNLKRTDSLSQYLMYFIEGIGAPTDPFLIFSTSDSDPILVCSYIGSVQYYSASHVFPGDSCAPVFYSDIIDSSHTLNLFIYPNPSSDKITISNYSFSGKEATVEIYNMMGEQIKPLQTISNNLKPETTMDVSNLAAGVYLVEVLNGEEMWRGKMVKE